jgi:DNA-binding transcriptional LysR family regulator
MSATTKYLAAFGRMVLWRGIFNEWVGQDRDLCRHNRCNNKGWPATRAGRFPQIRFRIIDGSGHEGIESVRRGEAEFGINIVGGSESDMRFTPLLEEPYVLICRSDHRLAARKQVYWKDLEKEVFIGLSRASGNRSILENALAQKHFSQAVQFEVSHLSTALGIVEEGLGVSILPKLAAPTRKNPGLTWKPVRDLQIIRVIGLLERRHGSLSPAAARFRKLFLS